jgi:hypothetical protein
MFAIESAAQGTNQPSSLLQYNSSLLDIEGDGYMVAGDLWDTVMPFNTDQPGTLGSPFRGIQGGLRSYMHLGSEDAAFFNPGGMWPNAYRIVNLFRNARKFGFTGFDPNGWPGYQAGNPIFDIDQGKDSKYMVAMFGPNVAGANDPARNYRREARYTDASRTHLIYEAGWPTTAGIDFKLRAHQYTPNEQNLNDFVVLEITLTNTGTVDSNADGTPEATDHVVEAVAASMQGETAPSIKIGFGGDRTRGPDGASTFGAGRTFGYIGAPDENGHPADIFAYIANVPPGVTSGGAVPGAGKRDFGINNYANKDGYTDVWGGWRWMGVKQGAIADAITGNSVNEAAFSAVTAGSPDKLTLFGTHPVGDGPERGWYTSHTFQPQLVTYRWNNSVKEFLAATAVWYADYGRTTDGGAKPADLNPNSRFFLAGSSGDVTTFVPNPLGNRPNGDYKYGPEENPTPGSGVQQPVWEAGWNPALAGNTNPTDADFYKAIGYNREWTFGESNKYGVGPFSLGVGESMTIVFVASAGFRYEGIRDATRAAEWAWEKGWQIDNDLPVPPAPEMKVSGTAAGNALVNWTDVSDIDPDVDGYKVWRATQYRRYKWLEEGMRIADRFHHQHEVGASKDAFKDAVNPYFDFVFTGSETAGSYQPEEWGTYELVAKIPVGDLSQYAGTAPYDYAYEDETSILGFTYWYYVSAYKEGGSWNGPLGPVTAGHLESSGVVNRNGRNTNDIPEGTIGMGSPWYLIYPFAWNHPGFPRTGTLSHKNMGASFTVTPPVAPVDQVEDLITVTPNPYKITGLNDVRNNPSSHDIKFLNVPSDFTLTIVDVSGQIIFSQDVQGQSNGQYIWNMFSKDGVEVASGLYIYHITYGNDQEVVGHFAILR